MHEYTYQSMDSNFLCCNKEKSCAQPDRHSNDRISYKTSLVLYMISNRHIIRKIVWPLVTLFLMGGKQKQSVWGHFFFSSGHLTEASVCRFRTHWYVCLQDSAWDNVSDIMSLYLFLLESSIRTFFKGLKKVKSIDWIDWTTSSPSALDGKIML